MIVQTKRHQVAVAAVQEAASIGSPPEGKLGWFYQLVLCGYVVSVIVFSYQDGLTWVAKVLASLLGLLFFYRLLSQRQRLFFPREFVLLFTWMMLGTLSSLLAVTPEQSLSRIVTLVQVYPMALLISNFIYWGGDSRLYWRFVLFSAVASAVLTSIDPQQYMSTDGRLYGTLSNANAYAAMLAVAVAIAIAGHLCRTATLTKILLIGVAVVLMPLLAETGSRMGMLAGVLGVVAVFSCFALTGRQIRFQRAIVALSLGSLLVSGAVLYLSASEHSARLQSMFAIMSGERPERADGSMNNRLWLYKRAFEAGMENPITGIGLNTFKDLEFAPGRKIGNNSHSNYMEIFASTGLLGVFLYFSIYVSIWSRLLRARSNVVDADQLERYMIAFAIALAFLLFDAAWVTYYEKLVWLLLPGVIAEAHLLSRAR